jgi:hypothetical protein
MKNTIKHYHFTFQGKNILCAVDYENHIRQYDVTIWSDNRIIGREKMKSVNREKLNRLVKDKINISAKKAQKTTLSG